MSDNLHNVRLWDWEELRDKLKALGCEISDTRVPFTYHHDMARDYALMTFSASLSRSDIAAAIDNACAGIDDLYDADTFLGCVAYHLKFAKPEIKIKMMLDEALMVQVKMCQKIMDRNSKTLFWYVNENTARV